MIKMLVVDLDGTLLNSNEEISQINIDAINKAREAGVVFVIATGRPEQLVKKYVVQLNYIDDLIMYNGSVIGHPFRRKRKLSYTIPNQYFLEIVSYGLAKNKQMLIYTQDAIYSEPNNRVNHFTILNKKLPNNQKAIFKSIKENYEELLTKEINKIMFIEKDKKSYEETINQFRYINDLVFVKSQSCFLDINHCESSKGNAIAHLAKSLNIKASEIMVIGDQENDISMFKFAGLSVAVANASEKVKKHADFITSSNNDHGVANAINEHIFNEHMFK